MSLSLPESLSASDLVDRHNPMILKRTITEYTLSDDDWKGHDSIRVVCRFRPPNKRELAFSRKKAVPDTPPEWDSEQAIRLKRVKNPKSQSKSSQKPFKCTLDSILKPSTTQKQIFYLVGQPMILSSLEGFNSTIFAYGQSGSGKTYTMFGPENDTSNVEQFGLIPRCFIYLFQKLNTALSNNGGNLQDYKVTMELLQIYKRDLLDLLNPKSKVKLIIKTDFRTDTVFVQNLRTVEVNTVEEAFACLTEAQSNRIVAGHALNSVSSRSHMLVMVNIVQRAIDGSVKRSKLNFGDLAGSEDLTKALGKNPDPERRQEAIAINSSLSALTTAMSFLSKGKKPGYRDSPLTHILKDSLGGNSKTTLFVACSPHVYNRNETIRALRFAQTAKKVKNKAKKNEEQSAASLKKRIKELELQVSSLQAQLVESRGKQKVFKKAISRMVVDDGLGRRSLSLRLPPGNVPKKPGPIPLSNNRSDGHGSPYSPMNVPQTIPEQQTSPMHSGNYPPMRSQAMSVSLSMENMIKPQTSVDHEEWSGSDNDEPDVVYSDGEEELAVDELLKGDDAGEEELNYIHEISELRRKLEDALKSNNTLNRHITSKNIELEHCNNQIAQLVEEVEHARKETTEVRRTLSPVGAGGAGGAGAATAVTFQNAVPNYDEDSLEYSDEHSPLPPIPLPSQREKLPHVIGSASSSMTLTPGTASAGTEVEPLTTMESQLSVMDGHDKIDSGFSFAADQNNTMLKYLMELQTNIQAAKLDFEELRHSVQEQGDRSVRFISATVDEEDEELEEDSESSQDMAGIEEREAQINRALRENLNKKKNRSCFDCFAMDTTEDDGGDSTVTSLLVEEYLKTHVRAEMKKQSRKQKKRKKRKREKRKKRSSELSGLGRDGSIDPSFTYNFDADELSVLTVSPTHTPTPATDLERPVSFQSDVSQLLSIQEIDDAADKKKSGDRGKKYQFHVDSLGDSRRDINTNVRKTKPRERKTRV